MRNLSTKNWGKTGEASFLGGGGVFLSLEEGPMREVSVAGCTFEGRERERERRNRLRHSARPHL